MTMDDDYSSYPLVKQSKIRKLCTYTSSNSSSGSSTNTSPNTRKPKAYAHTDTTDEGYASFTTTNSTTLASNNSTIFNKDDSAYYTSASDRVITTTTATTTSSSSSSKLFVESDSEKSETSDDEDVLKDLVDWPSLNHQVQTLVSRLDNWLRNPLPDRSIPIEKSFVEHAYPILQRQNSSLPLSISLATNAPEKLSNQSNYTMNFVQNSDPPEDKPTRIFRIPRPRVHFQLQTEQLQHCTTCSRLIQLTSSTNKQQSLITCPYCEQIYCSKICQKSDWPIHKRQCMLSNSYSCCGHILRLMKSNIYLLKRLSALASSGYISSGRGATLLYFDSMKEANTYVQLNNLESTRLMAIYWPLTDVRSNRAIDNLRLMEYEHLKELCMNYDPSQEFVCHVTIRVEKETDDTRYTCVSRTIVYQLLNIQPTPHPSSTYPTLYLTSLNYGDEKTVDNVHHMRQVFFAKLQVELRERGIEIEEHYPELYHQLCDYISPTNEQDKMVSFTPVCLFMRHRHSQQLFMCVITPESEPDRSWLVDRCLIEKQLAICDQ